MQIPLVLRVALEREAARFKLPELTRAQERLSESYRAGTPIRLGDVERAAYAVTRMPATYAACRAVLGEVLPRVEAANTDHGGDGIASLLDLGAGLGSLLWAAAETIPTLERATLIDADTGMIQLGRVLAAGADQAIVRKAVWRVAELESGIGAHADGSELDQHDLVACSYSLGEMSSEAAARVLALAWRATRKVLVIIEPGTTAGFARVRQWRDQLLAPGTNGGAHMVAPCPHARVCPLLANDWCHFAQRVERTALHRRLKSGSLGHEDEKFSYLAVSMVPVALPEARIIRHPQVAPGAIKLEICASDGLRQLVATKKSREQFRRARHAAWGQAWKVA